MSAQTPYSIAIAGSTEHTVMCAEALLKDPRFSIQWILTPTPRLIGRKQILTQNPLHEFAEKNAIPTILVDKKIDSEIKSAVQSLPAVDFLLVVDFGYLIPQWLLELPKIAPLNIHPSELPKFRGATPGQFTLLFGEKTGAVTLMKMDIGLDTGDLIYLEKFPIAETWTSVEYYQHAFELISLQLADRITEFAEGKLVAKPQPTESPTPIAGRLNREDGFVSWELLQNVMSNSQVQKLELESQLSPFLYQAISSSYFTSQHPDLNISQFIFDATRALSPWPGIWTLVNTTKGEKRLKILESKMDNDKFTLEKVQLEGSQPTKFEEIKNQINI